ncbi:MULTISPECIES: DUF1090 family protein [Pantoea]|uniref:DUF1090 domain-containing protein n=1 Tax=Candidatus Pantoea gossypiicola TaxID=2608008 RepID=A0AB34CD62_9GAMM|nr:MULTISPECIES: DUF1090 family protein [Pantoea]KAA5923339.1 DUF1090 domain-containing protein [Pantoea sp. VH_8]KAA5928796.1 DUF1090 domain-containing protein [Pantoea sp. VH_4]KAA5980306.1 DUF1090 domain-containing protein [Pantoea sp. M_4]KAA6119840.1 DUF1090 domain-containing protein [Pantoea gossypiicola]
MKKTIIALIFVASPLTVFAATDSCKDQLADISAKREMAKIHGNSAEIARLNIARDKIETYCTDERQATRASHDVRKREIKVKKAELELQEAEQDLAEAKAEGRTDRIKNKINKIEEKKLKLESAKLDLQEAQDDAHRLN